MRNSTSGSSRVLLVVWEDLPPNMLLSFLHLKDISYSTVDINSTVDKDLAVNLFLFSIYWFVIDSLYEKK